MKKHEVPQDQADSLQGQRKAMYAVDEDGHYGVTPSNGWEAEALVLDQAIEQFASLSNDARQRVEQGMSSPLEYHMYRKRMDVTVLAQSTGFFKWQVRRHLLPAIFSALSESKKRRYCEALGLSLAELGQMPTEPAQ